MPITDSTRYSRVSLFYSTHGHPTGLYATTDEQDPVTYQFFWDEFSGNFAPSGNADAAALEALRDHYIDNNFQILDANDEPIVIDVTGYHITGVDDLNANAPDKLFPNLLLRPTSEANVGITSLGNRYYRLQLWRAALPNAEPTNPPTNWWSENGVQTSLGGWHRTRAAAVTAGGAAATTMWFAIDDVAIDDEDAEIYNGWQKFQEFGVEYSADGVTWRSTQETGDNYFGFRTSTGVRRVVEITHPDIPEGPNLEWTQLYNGDPYKINQDFRVVYLGTVINLDLYKRLRFVFTPFGNWVNSGRHNIGAEVSCILHKPSDGWRTSTALTEDDDVNGTITWWFDEVNGAEIFFQNTGTFDRTTIPAAVTRGNDDMGHSLPASRLGGKMKLLHLSTESNPLNISYFRLYDFGTGSTWQRFSLRILGATY